MKVKFKLDAGAFVPTKAHKQDAGFDVFARDSKIIRAGCSEIFDTGVHIYIPDGYAGLLCSKSGLNIKHGLTSEGVIDAGYVGSVCVKLYNNSDESYEVKCGDKISQLLIIPIIDAELEQTDEVPDTERGSAGFGSSGR